MPNVAEFVEFLEFVEWTIELVGIRRRLVENSGD